MDKMPQNLWHFVRMSHDLPISDPASSVFQLSWATVEKGVPLSALEEFETHSGLAVKDLLEVVIPARS